MGRYTTKEDDVDRISTSVYVTNFPDNVSAKELFLACKQYGHVVDSYIPVKKSKYGKRFGFVKFINVFSEERLVNNLCTVWIGRVRLHANIARFQRPNGDVLNGIQRRSWLGRVKFLLPLAYLNMALGNEGFDIVIKIYMEKQWVIKATNEFEVDGRIAWVEVEGVPFKLWTNNTFTRIAEKWGKLLDVDDQDETCFHLKELCVGVPEFTDEYESEDDKTPNGMRRFTPLTHNCENDTSEKKVDQNDEFSEAGDVDKLKGSANGSISAGHFKVMDSKWRCHSKFGRPLEHKEGKDGYR
ncbi:nucleotide-binding alpha-beta plait domain-containing protein [Tanacetum coccineum]